MNRMKKYLKMAPVILYPYVYLIWVVMYLAMMSLAEWVDGIFQSDISVQICMIAMLVIAVLYQIVALVMAIRGSRQMMKSGVTAKEAAKMNMVTKCVQIPAYIFHFIVGVFSLALSVWGIGFLIFVCVVDVLTIILSGIFSIGCMMRMKKSGLLRTAGTVACAVGSFIYCVDVGIAIWMYVRAKKKESPQDIMQ